MKKHKRDNHQRAYKNGVMAGWKGHSNEMCPYSNPDIKECWLGGWRKGWADYKNGYIENSSD